MTVLLNLCFFARRDDFYSTYHILIFVGQVGNLPPIANRPVEDFKKIQQQAD